MFERIVVGVDGSPAGFDALRQAQRLLASDGRLVAVTAVYPELAVHAGFGAGLYAPTAVEQLWTDARSARATADKMIAGLANAEARLVHGPARDVLLAAAAQEHADLLAVGSHGTGRLAGIAFGSVATAVLHDAPCPVLVARPAVDSKRFPRRILVGYDGSEGSDVAADLADELGEQLDASVRKLESERDPVSALTDASREVDLVVVGSRGLHGLGALGSVSERVAHRAACSVLVARPVVTRAGPALRVAVEAT